MYESKNVRSCHSNQVVWQRSFNRDASIFRTSVILKLSYIPKVRVNSIIKLIETFFHQVNELLV